MRYGEIKNCDIANGEGVRVTLFVSGCTHHCKGCFNPDTWDFDYGMPYTTETEESITDMLRPSYKQRALLSLVKRVKLLFPEKDIWCYSGYTFEELTEESRARCECTDELLSYIDVLVDGEFVEEKKNISLAFRGSENQRIIDLKKTFEKGDIVIYELECDKIK